MRIARDGEEPEVEDPAPQAERDLAEIESDSRRAVRKEIFQRLTSER
jgi:hypothetical protein